MVCSKIQCTPEIIFYLVILSANFFHAQNKFVYAKDSNDNLGKIMSLLINSFNTFDTILPINVL